MVFALPAHNQHASPALNLPANKSSRFTPVPSHCPHGFQPVPPHTGHVLRAFASPLEDDDASEAMAKRVTGARRRAFRDALASPRDARWTRATRGVTGTFACIARRARWWARDAS